METLSSTPLYQQIVTNLKGQIASGTLKVGDYLPTETSICAQYNVSRSTVRQAYSILEHDGVIVRKRGIGTIVCEPKLKRSLNNLYNFSSEMRILGLTPSSYVLRFKTINPPQSIADILEIPVTQRVYYIKRLRMADNEPLLLERAYIPVALCPNLTEEDLSDSLYATIQSRSGTTAAIANETYEAVTVTDSDASILRCKPKSAALKICRTSINTNGEIFEHCIITARGDRNMYQVTLTKNNIEYSRSIT